MRILICFIIFVSVIGYAISKLAESPWPSLGHDNQRSGRSPIAAPSSAPKHLWTAELPYSFSYSEPTIAVDGTLYVTSLEDVVTAISPAGQILYNTPASPKYFTAAPTEAVAVSTDGHLYTGGFPFIYAVKQDSGALAWQCELPGDSSMTHSVALTGNGALLLTSTKAASLAALSLSDPTKCVVHWSHSYGAYAWGGPALSPDDAVVYVVGMNNHFPSTDAAALAFDVQSGRLLWNTTLSGSNARHVAVAPNGHVIVTSSQTGPNFIWSLDPQTGFVVFRVPAAAAAAPAFLSNGIVFGTMPGAAAMSFSGEQLWETEHIGANCFENPIVAADDSVFISCYDGKLHVLDGSSGAERYAIDVSPRMPAGYSLGSDGTVYVVAKSTYTERLYAAVMAFK